jgi:hypothetical protein
VDIIVGVGVDVDVGVVVAVGIGVIVGVEVLVNVGVGALEFVPFCVGVLIRVQPTAPALTTMIRIITIANSPLRVGVTLPKPLKCVNYLT